MNALTVAFLFLTNLSTTVEGAGGSELRILFIGNSLTYWNDLPAIVQAMAKAAKSPCRFCSVSRLRARRSLDRGDALQTIKKERWDIVAQQGFVVSKSTIPLQTFCSKQLPQSVAQTSRLKSAS
jgi:hypothetical protein